MSRVVREPDRQLSPWDQAPYFQPVKENWFVGIGAQGMVCSADTSRVYLAFSNPGNGDVYVSTSSNVAVNRGIYVPPTNMPVVFMDSESGPLCKQAWYAFNNGAAPVLTVVQILLSKWPGE